MLNLTRIYGGVAQPMDSHRYGHGQGAPKLASERRPIVVWNITRRCNLACLHCYSDSEAREYPGELNWDQIQAVIEDLAKFQVPAVLLSGGEPLIHPRFFDIATEARNRGLRLTLSTNGTLIDAERAQKIRDIGFSYVGISLDGIGATHDHFRGRAGAFDKTVAAFRNCKAVGQKVGLRLTLSSHTIADLENILDFIEREEIDRVCFYHLVYSGRGAAVESAGHERTRRGLDKIMERVRRWRDQGSAREVLTVDQPADAAYTYLKLMEEDPARAEETAKLLRWNGGGANSSGIGIGNIDTQGNVHPDQFWHTVNLGNVKQTPFSEIWTQSQNPILKGLRNRKAYLQGRCSQCKFLDMCGGGFRVRAEQVHGNPWASDPGCYLTDEEVGASHSVETVPA